MAKALVLVKRCIDYTVQIRLKPDGSGIETQGVKTAMNPFDEIAVEEAVRLKEKNLISEIVALSIGPVQAQDTLRQAMAMGADRAVHIETNEYPEPLQIAKTLTALAKRENADLVLLGKQAIDDDYGHEGVMTATMLDWNGAFNAAAIAPDWMAVCETDTGTGEIKLALPAVITADLRLNEPRKVPLPKVLEARKKPLESLSFADLGVAADSRLETLNVSLPQPRAAVVMLNSLDELIAKIDEARA